jgi:hypothetical protein
MRITGYKSHGVGASAALVNAVTSTDGDNSDVSLRAILAAHGFAAAAAASVPTPAPTAPTSPPSAPANAPPRLPRRDHAVG